MEKLKQKISRKEQILQALASMLEASPCKRITTAALAKEVGVSEAALYRHFPSKAKMFEGLIEFAEGTIFPRINLIIQDNADALLQCQHILILLLKFSENNPGITRILTGDAIIGESERLQARVTQLFDRVETQLKTILKEAEIKEGKRTSLTPTQSANLLLASAEGRISQFVRSGFERKPTQYWDAQWALLTDNLFRVS